MVKGKPEEKTMVSIYYNWIYNIYSLQNWIDEEDTKETFEKSKKVKYTNAFI
jgi:hypothetical protein